MVTGLELMRELYGDNWTGSAERMASLSESNSDVSAVWRTLQAEFDWTQNKPAVVVDTFIVAPHHRKEGYGSSILRDHELKYQQEGIEYMVIHCAIDNKDAQRFYERNGYTARAIQYVKVL